MVVGRVARQPDFAEDEHPRVLERLVEEFALFAVGQFSLGLEGGGERVCRGSMPWTGDIPPRRHTHLFEQVERFDASWVFEFVRVNQE